LGLEGEVVLLADVGDLLLELGELVGDLGLVLAAEVVLFLERSQPLQLPFDVFPSVLGQLQLAQS
jgi:hypothetical protein